eukprot:2447333-Alexandrium_andersonii.AAC.1
MKRSQVLLVHTLLAALAEKARCASRHAINPRWRAPVGLASVRGGAGLARRPSPFLRAQLGNPQLFSGL